MREWLLAALLLSWALPGVTLAELLLLTEEAPPTSFLQGGKPAGLAVEVVEQLRQRSATPAHIELQPWTRGYQLVKTQADTALFLMVRTPEREALFQWVGPILQGTTNFYSLKANHLQLHSIEAAKQAGTVAVPKQWYTYEALAALGFDLYGTRGAKQMVSMLKAGRVKLIATEDLTQITGQAQYLEDFYAFFAIRPQIRSPARPAPVPRPIREGLVFEGVGYRYPGTQTFALRDLSFAVRAGRRWRWSAATAPARPRSSS